MAAGLLKFVDPNSYKIIYTDYLGELIGQNNHPGIS